MPQYTSDEILDIIDDEFDTDTIPSHIKCIRIECSITKIRSLPPGLEILQFIDIVDSSLIGFGVPAYKLDNNYSQSLNLPSSLQVLELNFDYNKSLTLPPNLRVLGLGERYNKVLRLPSNLKVLVLGQAYNKPLELPNSLKILQLDNSNNIIVRLPPFLKRFYTKIDAMELYYKHVMRNYNIIDIEFGDFDVYGNFEEFDRFVYYDEHSNIMILVNLLKDHVDTNKHNKSMKKSSMIDFIRIPESKGSVFSNLCAIQ